MDVEMKKYPKRVMVFAGELVRCAEVVGASALTSEYVPVNCGRA